MSINYTTLKFDSCGELAAHVEQLQANDTRRHGTTSTDTDYPEFYGNWSIGKALTCGLAGGAWQEGAEAMPRLHMPHETLSGQPLDAPMIESDVAGFAPNVPAHLTGAPDSMFTMVDQPASDRLLRVAVHVGRVGSATQSAILNRGAAIMAVLDQLTKEGYSVELWALWRNDDYGIGCSIETCIKHSTDHWSPESVAFALAHAAFQRRLCWRVAESIDTAEHAHGDGAGVRITDGGYGAGNSADFSDYDLAYGYVTTDVDRAIRSPESAVDYIKEVTLKQLKTREKKLAA